MERHLTCHPNMFSKNLKCPDCAMKFYSLAKMLKHDRKKHTGVKDYECRLCGAEVTEIQVHMKVSQCFGSCQFSPSKVSKSLDWVIQ